MKRTVAPWNRPIMARMGPVPGTMVFDYNGKEETRPVLTCRHCRSRVLLNPDRRREREHCVVCNGYVCDDCKKCPTVGGM